MFQGELFLELETHWDTSGTGSGWFISNDKPAPAWQSAILLNDTNLFFFFFFSSSPKKCSLLRNQRVWNGNCNLIMHYIIYVFVSWASYCRDSGGTRREGMKSRDGVWQILMGSEGWDDGGVEGEWGGGVVHDCREVFGTKSIVVAV